MEYFTPGSTNKVFEGLTKSEKILKDDPYGIGIAFISMFTVFSALIIIYLIMKLFSRMNRKTILKPIIKKTIHQNEKPENEEIEEDITSEEIAAAMMALHLYLTDVHDTESEIITIETPSAHYSPWAQKHLIIKKVQRKR